MDRNRVSCALLLAFLALATASFGASQPVTGVEHWVNNGPIKLYVWEKYVETSKDKPIIVLAHGSATAGKESFDLQVPGKPTYSLMDVLAEHGFDVFALDVRGFGRSTHPEGHMTTAEASQDLTVPVMIIHGQYDDVADLDGLFPFFAQLPNPRKQYVVVPDAGHMMHLQKGHRLFQHEVIAFFSAP